MNILIVNKFYYLRGGSERQVFDLTELLEKSGHKVVPFSMQDDRNQKSEFEKYFIEKIDLHKLKVSGIIKYFYNYDAVRRLKQLLREERIDVAHLHNFIGQISPAILKVLKDNGIPIVATLHDYRLFCPNGQLFSKGKICHKCAGKRFGYCFLNKCMHNSYQKSLIGSLEAYFNSRFLDSYAQIDRFIAPSAFMRDSAAAFGIPKEKIAVIYNYLDFDSFKFSNTEKHENYLLYFGRLSGEKGLDILLEAFRSLSKGISLKIAGEGAGAMRLRDKIKEMKLEDRIALVGFKKGTALTELIQRSRAVILPSFWPENMPYSLLEAMANEKVVIASDIGGMKELIRDGENGFLFETGNSSSLAQKISQLNAYDLSLIGKRAKDRIVGYSAEYYYKNLMEIYGKLLASNEVKNLDY